jgi:hypothetical protein
MGMEETGTTPKAKGTQKPSTLRALSASDKLSVFDIHNTFQHCWFLSQDHNAILAQKAKNRKKIWVEFAL